MVRRRTPWAWQPEQPPQESSGTSRERAPAAFDGHSLPSLDEVRVSLGRIARAPTTNSSVHLVSFAEARGQALANGKLARAGRDPLADKRRVQGMPTFAEAAVTVVEQKQAGWRSLRQAADWLNNLKSYVFARIGSRLVSEINSTDVLAIVTPLWHVKMRTARTLRPRTRAVLECSIATVYRTDNPATESSRSSARNARSCCTCGGCPIVTWPPRSTRCGRRERRGRSSLPSSGWCDGSTALVFSSSPPSSTRCSDVPCRHQRPPWLWSPMQLYFIVT